MAKSRTKTQTKKIKGRLSAIIVCICLLVVATLAITDYFGIFTYEKLISVFGLNNGVVVDGDLSVHFINVGQGDCSLIISNGETALIDAGEAENADTVVSYLNSQGIKRLDYVIVSHPHSDHMGGISIVLESFEIGKVIVPKVSEEMTPTTKTYKVFLQTVQNEGLKLTPARVGDVYNLGEASLEVLAPNSEYKDLNNYSVVALLTHGENKFLFTGDAESESEKEMLKKGLLTGVDVLKVGHHGSNTSSKKKFLEVVRPDYAVIMCGDNSYNHPHKETIDNLLEYTDNIYRTDQQGTIVFISDGENLNVRYE
ncbi:MAG: MBL fold metallo-hydrolase [Clostridiales bacterium]|jgi:competence protein ComEC|nr:MBL fold metallo-hydrolase [Clostridiales bacterium]